MSDMTVEAWEAAMEQVLADYDLELAEVEWARKFTMDQRKALAKSGAALPDGSFPIEKPEDVKAAVHLARTPEQRAHVIKMAKALGCMDLIPDDWTKA